MIPQESHGSAEGMTGSSIPEMAEAMYNINEALLSLLTTIKELEDDHVLQYVQNNEILTTQEVIRHLNDFENQYLYLTQNPSPQIQADLHTLLAQITFFQMKVGLFLMAGIPEYSLRNLLSPLPKRKPRPEIPPAPKPKTATPLHEGLHSPAIGDSPPNLFTDVFGSRFNIMTSTGLIESSEASIERPKTKLRKKPKRKVSFHEMGQPNPTIDAETRKRQIEAQAVVEKHQLKVRKAAAIEVEKKAEVQDSDPPQKEVTAITRAHPPQLNPTPIGRNEHQRVGPGKPARTYRRLQKPDVPASQMGAETDAQRARRIRNAARKWGKYW